MCVCIYRDYMRGGGGRGTIWDSIFLSGTRVCVVNNPNFLLSSSADILNLDVIPSKKFSPYEKYSFNASLLYWIQTVS
jgi:hypothetical protein